MEKRSSLDIQRSVIHALLLREMRTRFGQFKLGYLWAFLQPAAHVLFFTLLFGVRSNAGMAGVAFPVFVSTGLVPWMLFRSVLTNSMNAADANSGLFSYHQVKPIDAVVARTVLETLFHVVVLAVLLGAAAFAGFEVEMRDPLSVAGTLCLLIALGAGMGMLFCSVSLRFPDFSRILPIVMMPWYMLSGIFFSVEIVPEPYRSYILWNPVLHGVELVREGFFLVHKTGHGDLGYLTVCSALALTAGMIAFRADSRRIVSQ